MLTLLLTGFSTVLSTIALAVALHALRQRTLPTRRIADVELEHAELLNEIDALKGRMKRLTARVGMREAREKLTEGPPLEESSNRGAEIDYSQRPGESSHEWKTRIRRLRAGVRTNGG